MLGSELTLLLGSGLISSVRVRFDDSVMLRLISSVSVRIDISVRIKVEYQC